jgi:hypothetical protein
MRSRGATFILLLATAIAPAGAPAMSPSGKAAPGRCHVVGSEELPSASGGASAICAEVERAVAAVAPAARYSAEVKVLSRSRLAATLVVDGRTLPEQNFAIMDRELNPGAIQRFARSLAAEIAKAAKR